MNIPLEKLRQVKVIVTHDKCPDGIASALILQDALAENGLTVIFTQYGSEELASLKAVPGMLFCDFHPEESRAQEFADMGAIVLDHHKTSEKIIQLFGENGIYSSEPGVSGAVLAYREVWLPIYEAHAPGQGRGHMHYPEHIEEIATLAGIRDTWQKKDPRWVEACIQAYGLLFIPQERFVGCASAILGAEWNRLMWAGKIQYEKGLKRAARAIRDSFKFVTPKGTRVAVFEGVTISSDAAEVSTDFDLVIGFDFFVDKDVPKLIFSTRSRSDFDCGSFCKANGGGGHMKAAGFNIEFPTLSPWSHIQERVLKFEE
jgi:hypothetical protein